MSRPVRVLHIITRLIVGGAQENTLLTVIGQKRNPDFKVTLLCGIDGGPEGDLHDKAREAGVDLVLMPGLVRPIRPLTDARILVRLYRFIREGKFDIVHTHSSKAGILGRIAARMAGTPVVIHTLHSLVFHPHQSWWTNRLYIILKRLCAPLTDILISVNDKTAQGALAAGIGRPDQYTTIFSGMNLEPFLEVENKFSVAEARQHVGIPANALVVGKIARFFPLKGYEQFFEAAARIVEREPEAWFLLIGDGLLRGKMEEQARRLGIAERTVFAGLVPSEDIPRLILAMDVLVHTSLREGIARVLPQAGSVGKPVVTFDMDGAPEVIREGLSGYLVSPLDTRALADRVVELLRDPGRRQAFGRAGREIAKANFRVEEMVERINALYYRLLEQKKLLLLSQDAMSKSA